MRCSRHSLERLDFDDRSSEGRAHRNDQRLISLHFRKSKLESVNETSGLFSGFAIVALVEFSIDSYTDDYSNDRLLISYVVVSCLLVGVHLLALLMSICILPELKTTIYQKNRWINNENEEPLSSIDIYIDIAWYLSTGVGLLLILVELALVFWIKLGGISRSAAISAVVTLCLVGCPFVVFAIGFYIRITRSKVSLQLIDSESVERGAIARGIYLNNMTPSTTSSTAVLNAQERR